MRIIKKAQREELVTSIKQKYEAFAEVEIGRTLDKLPLNGQSGTIDVQQIQSDVQLSEQKELLLNTPTIASRLSKIRVPDHIKREINNYARTTQKK